MYQNESLEFAAQEPAISDALNTFKTRKKASYLEGTKNVSNFF